MKEGPITDQRGLEYWTHGQDVNTCNVTPKDKYVEAGSDTEVVCQSSCVRGKVFWTLNNGRIKESLSKTINSSHTMLSLKNFTYHSAMLQCHSATTHNVIGGAIIKTYMKIIPPKTHVTVSSDNLLVEWEESVVERQCHCEVKFSKAVSDGTERVVNRTLNTCESGRVMEKLESCTTYKVSVRCALVGAPWSDWSQEETAQTDINEVDIKLQLWRKVAKPQSDGVRKVHAMWTEVPATCPGTFTYAIKATVYDEHETEVNYTGAFCSSSACGDDVHVGPQAHKLNLAVFRNGTQLAEESVYVPAIKESLPQVSEVTPSATEGVILVSWKPPVEPVRSYMIDWTHGGHEYHWMETTYPNRTLFGLLGKTPYNITVTPLFDDRTGHGTEALQVCATLGDPGNISPLTVHTYDTSAYVNWSIQSQECSEVVLNYTIFYSSTQEGPKLNITVDGTHRTILLEGLNPNTKYSVYIKGTALNGTTQSKETVFHTKRFDPRLVTVLSVSGSVGIILVVFLGLCCAVQWKKFREKPVPNPGLSSLALWPSSDHQKAFSNPSESLCDMVYTVEPQGTSISPLGSGCNRAIDKIEEYTDPATLGPNAQNEKLAELEEKEIVSSGESTALLLPPVDRPFSPYRSQSSVEIKSPGTGKQCKPFPAKQQEKTAPMTVYVTLNMFEQGQGRESIQPHRVAIHQRLIAQKPPLIMAHTGPPSRWRNCPRRGQPVAGKFLPMKTMLGPRYDEQVAEENRFHPSMLSNFLKSLKVSEDGLLVDLTNTTRFYDRNDIEKEGIKYVKLQCKGHGECPSKETTTMFIALCEHFMEKNPTELIGKETTAQQ
ncbi:hypothetical protein INR49_028648 [Caranx melampygus]|nr:hypothetical protein INR49_028648 [Caranx melampygus]